MMLNNNDKERLKEIEGYLKKDDSTVYTNEGQYVSGYYNAVDIARWLLALIRNNIPLNEKLAENGLEE